MEQDCDISDVIIIVIMYSYAGMFVSLMGI